MVKGRTNLEKGFLGLIDKIGKDRTSSIATYRGDIDGLRAIAIIAVVLYHTNHNWIPGGYLGVDVFFVISGFLITRMIENNIALGNFSITAFYERRIRRIFPALFVMVGLVLCAGWFLLIPANLVETAAQANAAILSYANIYFLNQTGYFKPAVDSLLFIHTWSLSVEEQFYLVLPLILIFLAGPLKFGASQRKIALGVLALASLLSAYLFSNGHSNEVFYLPYFRAWELLAGSVLAYLSEIKWAFFHSWLVSLFGVGLILTSYFVSPTSPAIQWLLTIPAVLGSLILIFAGNIPTNLSNNFFEYTPLRFIGKISYSVYLWHWPILLFYRIWIIKVPTLLDNIICIAATFLAGWISWVIIENPIRFGNIFNSRKSLIVFFVAGLTVIISSSVLLQQNKGYPNRIANNSNEMTNDPNIDLMLKRCTANTNQIELTTANLKLCRLPINENLSESADTIIYGDSHARALIPAFAKIAQKIQKPILAITVPGCKPYLIENLPSKKETCFETSKAIEDLIFSKKWVKKIVITSYFMSTPKPLLQPALVDLITRMVNGGKTVYIIGSVPRFNLIDSKQALYIASLRGLSPDILAEPNAKDIRTQVEFEESIIKSLPATIRRKVRFVNIYQVFCNDTHCSPTDDDLSSYYNDNHHLSPEGAYKVMDILEKRIFQQIPK